MQGSETVRRLELQLKALLEAHSKDIKQIQDSDRELKNCYQEIDYLQEQLNVRDSEVIRLEMQVRDLKFKLADVDNLLEEVFILRKEIMKSDSERSFLLEELKSKEAELQQSSACIEKLEESISSAALVSECEIESMRFDLMTLGKSCSEAKKLQEETVEEKDRMTEIIRHFEFQIQSAIKAIDHLEKENKDLREELVSSEINETVFCQKVETQFEKLWEKHDETQLRTHSSSDHVISEDSIVGKILSLLVSKIASVSEPDTDLKNKMKKLSQQNQDYELLVLKLKEELREEKLKAKEEAEDLAQEMAELRFQMTSMLEHECKRRASVEQASLQRIAELEAQKQKGAPESVSKKSTPSKTEEDEDEPSTKDDSKDDVKDMEEESDPEHSEGDEPKESKSITKGSKKKETKDSGVKNKPTPSKEQASVKKSSGSSAKKTSGDADGGSSSRSKSKVSAAKKQDVEKGKEKNKGSVKEKSASKVKSTKSTEKVLSNSQGKGKSSKKGKAKPSREEMHAEVVNILKEVDFNTATLSDILRQLGTHFGVDLIDRKAEVKEIITDVINNMTDEDDEEDGEEKEDEEESDEEKEDQPNDVTDDDAEKDTDNEDDADD